MNSSVHVKPLPPNQDGQPAESREEKLSWIRSQVSEEFYSRHEVLRDVADALIMNPAAFEDLNERVEERLDLQDGKGPALWSAGPFYC